MSAVVASTGYEFDLDTGVLPLDFANTLTGRFGVQLRDCLGSYHDLLTFSRLAQTLDAPQADRLAAEADARPAEARATIERAAQLREAIYRIFRALAAGQPPDDADLAALNAAVARAMPHGRVVRHGDHFDWGWQDDPAMLDRPLWPVARAAADILLTGDLHRLRQCAADDCGWLFYDTSRNASRRWCSMSSCGNRAKVQQFRARRRGTRD
jgi:predicted RNA-binding Zn ribbon-like protein